ncbi:MAG: UbiA family prenyltransferase [Candidatus Aenigmatarchaeota archaeon]
MKIPYLPNLIKTVLQFLLGAIVFFFYNGNLDIVKILAGLFSISFAYIFVYTMNDILDYKTDIKNEKIKRRKIFLRSPLFKENIKIEKIISFAYISLVLGIFLSFFISPLFPFLILIILFTNFIHSNKIFATKEISIISMPNMFIMQFVKFSSGWLSQTSSFGNFPSLIFILFSAVYIIIYRILKRGLKLKESLKKEKFSIITLSFITVFSFFLSIFLYDITLPLLLTLIFCLIIYIPIARIKNFENKFKHGSLISIILLSFFLILLLLSKIDPFLWKANNEISYNIKNSKISKILGENFNTTIENIESLKEIICK